MNYQIQGLSIHAEVHGTANNPVTITKGLLLRKLSSHLSPPFVRPAFSGPFYGESFDVPEVHGRSAHPPEAKIS
jgi:hypothetical protein